MKRRRPPNTISKRLRRKLRRSKDPYLLWVRCRRHKFYARLASWWGYQWQKSLTHIEPFQTPFVSQAPKIKSSDVIHDWRLDVLTP